MKITQTHIRYARYAGICAACYTLTMMMLVCVFGVERYTVLIDNRIASHLAIDLANKIQSLPSGLRVKPDVSAAQIQEQFPWVNTLSFVRMPTKAMQVKVAIEEPQVKVNSLLITERLRVLPVSAFVQSSLASVPALDVVFTQAKKNEIPESFLPHAKTLIDTRFAPYALSWVDEYRARLTDKAQPHFSIIFNSYAIPDDAMFAQCAVIKKLLAERGSFSGRYKDTHWVADVRFDRQIIVFSEKGGMAHG